MKILDHKKNPSTHWWNGQCKIARHKKIAYWLIKLFPRSMDWLLHWVFCDGYAHNSSSFRKRQYTPYRDHTSGTDYMLYSHFPDGLSRFFTTEEPKYLKAKTRKPFSLFEKTKENFAQSLKNRNGKTLEDSQ